MQGVRCIAADLERGKRVLRGKRKTEEGKLIHKTTEYVKTYHVCGQRQYRTISPNCAA